MEAPGSGEWGVVRHGAINGSSTRRFDAGLLGHRSQTLSVHKYQSLVAWKRAHKLLIICLQSTDRAYHPRALPLFNQIRRAAISVEANIVEGYALESTMQFRKHLRIAMGSAAEAECLVRAASELNRSEERRVGKECRSRWS